jgi:nucleotide-binding universal stress UspA family protein
MAGSGNYRILVGVDGSAESRAATDWAGSPATLLVDASRDADVVAIGSRGLGGFSGLMLGSVSTQAVHHAQCPVLVFREKG